LEIYKEVIRDLLNPKASNLRIRESPTGELHVQGLSEEYVASEDDILNLIAMGEKIKEYIGNSYEFSQLKKS